MKELGVSSERAARTGATAEALGLSSATVQGYARRGLLPFSLTPGGHYRFNIDEVLEVLDRSPIREQEFVSVFDGGAAVVVDDLSAYRSDPVTPEVEARLRVRGADTRRERDAVPAKRAGGSAFRELLEVSRGSAVAVLHREPETV